ncbi:MAG: RHS repeat-associated core domain-containing protein, partial [Bacteroidota bacterium]
VWALDDGTQFVADDYRPNTSTNILRYVYNGVNSFSIGFYGNNTSLSNLSGMRYGVRRFSTSFSVHVNFSYAGSVSEPLNVGDVLEVKYSNGRYSLLRNGTEIHHYDNSGATSSHLLYPYFSDPSGTGLEQEMVWITEMVADQSPNFYNSGSWRVGSSVLKRGADGGIDMAYNGTNITKYRYVLWMSSKNTSFSYAVARFFFNPNTRLLYVSARNPDPDYQHLQTGGWNNYSTYLDPNEMYAGTKVRMAREGGNLVLYVNGVEKKRFNTDANIDLHPIMYDYFAGQEDEMRVTFGDGGMCDNYFNSTGSFVPSNDENNYYNPPATDGSWNHITTRTYDGQGESLCHVMGESRTYLDEIGREVQQQRKDVQTNQVWASEQLYDRYGRPAIKTLEAPTGSQRIRHQDNFVLDESGNPYGHDDFEGNKLNDPNEVGDQLNTVGWWYSSNNNQEEWQAVTDFPYVREEYSDLTGQLRRIAGAGDTYRMGEDHEFATYSMPAGSELRHVFGDKHPLCLLAGNSDYDSGNQLQSWCNSTTFTNQYWKTISVDPNGDQVVSFVDRNGNVVATAEGGGSVNNLRSTTIVVKPGSYRDIHLPKRIGSGTVMTLSGSGRNYTIYDLEDESTEANNETASSKFLFHGLYRVVNNNSTQNLTITYDINYLDYTLSIYNLRDQLVATVAPNDVLYNATSPGHKAYSIFRYNSLGQKVWEKLPDEGVTEYYFTAEGWPRFSQNAKQAAQGRYHYKKYNLRGREIEAGESSSSATSLAFRVDNHSFPTSGNTEQTYMEYDTPDSGFSLAGYTQTYLSGKVSKTWNSHETVWYSYDEEGRLIWEARDIVGDLTTKVTEYRYDLLGNVTEVIYQKNQTDEFRHQYGFDLHQRMTSVSTRRDDPVQTAATNQAQFTYTMDDKIEHRSLGGGLDNDHYIYTLSGQLKAVNPKDMLIIDVANGGGHPFSMALHYYKSDYRSANGKWKDTYQLPHSSSTSTSYNSFTGNIVASRWKARASNGVSDLSGHFAYRYRYTRRDELYQAHFANIVPYSNSSYAGQASYISDYYNTLSYDLNGNIKTLRRYSAGNLVCSGFSLLMDNLTYQYSTTPGQNRLRHINDSYSYNCTTDELTSQSTDNYEYNVMGQLVKDVQANHYIEYDSYGRVSKVRNGTNSSAPILSEYFYGPDGKRVRKRVFSGLSWSTTWYVGMNGKTQAIYQGGSSCISCTPVHAEVPIYAEERIGAVYPQQSWENRYELSDQVGNVRAVIRAGSDGKAEVLSYADYYPHGWELPARKLSASPTYRHTFQGQYAEKDEETGWNAFELRSYDARVGRWMTIDPYREFHSPYLAFGNQPHQVVDFDGGCTTCPDEVYVVLANHVYGAQVGDVTSHGWEVIDVTDNPSGLYGALYRGTADSGFEGQYIYATAGTEDLKKDGVEDLLQVFGESAQYSESVEIAHSLAEEYNEISFTGHSLGGGLASANALATETKAVTFNAAGLSGLTRKNLGLNGNSADITSYIVEGEILDKVQRNTGLRAEANLRIMLPSVGKNTFDKHKMGNVQDAFRIYQELIQMSDRTFIIDNTDPPRP